MTKGLPTGMRFLNVTELLNIIKKAAYHRFLGVVTVKVVVLIKKQFFPRCI